MAHDVADSELLRTPLAEAHERLGARMVGFGGWLMPVQYAGIIAEHNAVRSTAGVFDLSHMGEVEVRGAGAFATLQRVLVNDVSRIGDGQALYSPMCLPTGGIVDDVIVYRHAADRYLVIPNAANIAKDVEWLRAHAAADTVLEDVSPDTALIAIQGPSSPAVLGSLTTAAVDGMDSFSFLEDVDVGGVRAIVSRTGYTGETGFELYCPAGEAPRLWEVVLSGAEAAGGMAVGLGARDTLRLEARLSLYGADIDETTTPLEAGLGWTVAFDKGDFVGKAALLSQRDEGVQRRLVGLTMDGRGIARGGYPVYHGDGEIGHVTSGAPSPSLGVNIALAYIDVAHARVGGAVEVQVRRNRHAATVTRTPFYRVGAAT
ncbi:glycine cleavage system aminomethyltransferase GcvT [Candidatus Poribacteria bacterium]|nr:glycine cleavage system aminomethyltransferase GcvT [Candidatus Poribacteria bacterium]MBT5535486.1 glycine cleavage system aminomethyltransferase GcvT [Candidatus Poribacteria bacterium]MBT7805814.1 glycine cleavage system aminomethyltransferase GcvT [Candidatus Poribacteria bacterium]